MSIAENKALTSRVFDMMNNRRLKMFDELFAASVQYHGQSDPQVRDRAAWRDRLEALLASYPNMHITVEDVVAEGDRVAVRYTFRGTNCGPSPTVGIEAGGKKVEVCGMTIWRSAGGKVVEIWEIVDALTLTKQLGG